MELGFESQDLSKKSFFMNEEILKLIDELSFLCRETVGASFVIQHSKDTGKWKVVFNNVMLSSKERLKEKDFDDALKDAIQWLRSERKEIVTPQERFTLYSRVVIP